MNVIQLIKLRVSCRTYREEYLKPEDKTEIENFLADNFNSIGDDEIHLSLIEKRNETQKMKLNYGMLKGHNSYILGKVKSGVVSRVNYGYLVERLVLKATEMGLATCWVGYFDADYFNEIALEEGFEIPSIIVIGYSAEKQSIQDKFIRLSVNASKRFSWDKLFFDFATNKPLAPETTKEYSESLEMVRLAPSSGNTQPWRIFYDSVTKEFHFYKKPVNKSYETRGLHDIDLGIALSHFEMVSKYNGLSGSWHRNKPDSLFVNDDVQYIMSWKCL